MPSLDALACHRALLAADHGVLATVGADGVPHAVPVCFAVLDDLVVIPVDEVKAKSSARLRRVRNIDDTGRASLLLELWDPDDWSRLWWVRAELVSAGFDEPSMVAGEQALRQKHVQYRDATFATLIGLRIERLTGWRAQATTSVP